MKFIAHIKTRDGWDDVDVEVTADDHRSAVDKAWARIDHVADKMGDPQYQGARVDDVIYVPAVGDGVHFGYGGDSYPGTVVEISKSGHRVVVRRDRARVMEHDRGYKEGARKAVFIVDEDGGCEVFTRRENGEYRSKGTHGRTLCGGRVFARDPSF